MKTANRHNVDCKVFRLYWNSNLVEHKGNEAVYSEGSNAVNRWVSEKDFGISVQLFSIVYNEHWRILVLANVDIVLRISILPLGNHRFRVRFDRLCCQRIRR